MTWRQILGLKENEATRAIELDETHPRAVEGVVEFWIKAQRCVHVFRIAIRDQTSFLIGPLGLPKIMRAAIARPATRAQIDIQVFRDPGSPAEFAGLDHFRDRKRRMLTTAFRTSGVRG